MKDNNYCIENDLAAQKEMAEMESSLATNLSRRLGRIREYIRSVDSYNFDNDCDQIVLSKKTLINILNGY